MKIAVTGSEGKLGRWLVNVFGFTPLECDITNPEEIKDVINTVLPDTIIHCAAVTDVKYCEEHPKEAFNVNVRGTSNILDYFTRGTLIYLSTSHIFDGLAKNVYKEKSNPAPVNVYGWSKWGGELMMHTATCKTIIVRISKLFDLEYVSPMLLAIQNGTITEKQLVQSGLVKRTFVYVPHFIEGLLKLIDLRETAPNIINISGTDNLSYFEFWNAVAYVFECQTKFVKCSWDIGGVPRPWNGGLNVSLAGSMGIPLYSAMEGIKEMRKLL